MAMIFTDTPTKMKYLLYGPKDPIAFSILKKKNKEISVRCATLKLAKEYKKFYEDMLLSNYFETGEALDFKNKTWFAIYKILEDK